MKLYFYYLFFILIISGSELFAKDSLEITTKGIVLMDDKGGDLINIHYKYKFIEPTLSSITELNANYVAYVCYWDYYSLDPTPAMNTGDFTATDSSILGLAEMTHIQGMQFSLWLELKYDEVGGWSDPPYDFLWAEHDSTWWAAWFNDYEKYILHMAEIAEVAEIEMLIFLKQQDYAIGGPNSELTNSMWRNLIPKIRDVYSGKIGITVWAGGAQHSVNTTIASVGFADLLDLIILQFNPALTLASDLTIGQLEIELENWFNNFELIAGTVDCELQIYTNFNSADGQNGYVWFEPSTDQSDIKLDLLEQAIYYQAFINVLSKKSYISGMWSWGYCWENYFTTTGYRLAPSIRLKPASNVIQNAFGDNKNTFDSIIQNWNSERVKISGKINDLFGDVIENAVISISSTHPEYPRYNWYTHDFYISDTLGNYVVSNGEIKTLLPLEYRVSVLKPKYSNFVEEGYNLSSDEVKDITLSKLALPNEISNVKIYIWKVLEFDVITLYDEASLYYSSDLVQNNNGSWSTSVDLEDGSYYYNFEINNEIRIEDINSDEFYVTPKFGGKKYSYFSIEKNEQITFTLNPNDPWYLLLDDHSSLPSNYLLFQNIPNPFNPSTIIRYSLPIENDVTISIYDILGRRVNQIISLKQSSGSHSIEWNGIDNQGNHIGAGIYFYQIQAGDFIQTKKMVLMK